MMKRRLNPDKEIVKITLEGLRRNDGYCPCVFNSKGNKEYKCPCVGYRQTGECHCGLYVE